MTKDYRDLRQGALAIAGFPFDTYSSFLRGAAGAPELIWQAFHSDSANAFAENGMELREGENLHYLGNLPIAEYFDIEREAAKLLDHGLHLLAFGGDHSVTYPLIRAHASHYPDLTIVQLDAHSDLYDTFEGNRHSHACPFARIMEEQLAGRLVQLGVRSLTQHQREQAGRFGVEIFEMPVWSPDRLPSLQGPVYLTLDLDVLEPALAPGISHYEPGGLTVREVIRLIQDLNAPIIGADIVEYNPARDVNGITAMVAAKFFREIASKMVTGDGE